MDFFTISSCAKDIDKSMNGTPLLAKETMKSYHKRFSLFFKVMA